MTKEIETYRLIVTREEVWLLRAALEMAIYNQAAALSQKDKIQIEDMIRLLKGKT